MLIRELMGERKQKETLWGFVSVRCMPVILLQGNALFGRLCINSLLVAVEGGSEALVWWQIAATETTAVFVKGSAEVAAVPT